jgi:phosphoserine phosphatase
VADTQTVLLELHGRDRPGITSALMSLLDDLGATVADVEQVVVRGHLVLGLVVELPDDAPLDPIRSFAAERDLSVELEPADTTPTERRLGVVVTVIASSVVASDIKAGARELAPGDLGAVADAIAALGGNIDRIIRLSRYPVFSYELTVLGADIDALRADLVEVARRRSIDIAIQPDGLGRRSQRLVVLDVDSTLIQHEVIDLLAAEAGCAEQVASITERAMAGELDFEASLRARVALLEGLDEAALARALERMTLTPGAKTFVRTLRRMGFRVAIVSGGFTYFTDHLRRRLHIDHAFANKLEVVDGKLTGRVRGRVVDRRRKAELLERVARKEGIPLDQTVAVGDGANDLDMLARAGLGIAFNAKPVVADAADAALSVPYLDAILFLLGIRQSEVAAADAAGGLVPD